MRKETHDLIKQAKADLRTARNCLQSEDYYATAFFSHQAVEKILKAYFIIKRNKTPPKTHNLLDLALELNIPKNLLGIARELTPEFIITRYPDVAGGPPSELYDKTLAVNILNKAEVLFKWILKKIEK